MGDLDVTSVTPVWGKATGGDAVVLGASNSATGETMNDTTVHPETAIDITVLDDETRHSLRMLRARADSFVAQSGSLPEPLATAYRRRARELELEAFLVETRAAARAA